MVKTRKLNIIFYSTPKQKETMAMMITHMHHTACTLDIQTNGQVNAISKHKDTQRKTRNEIMKRRKKNSEKEKHSTSLYMNE